MSMLPPLNAIRAFEAAARTGSFTLAAAELGVSSAAVSQQIRNLEAYFAKKLFSRRGNRLTLTDAGHAMFAPTSQALGELAAVAGRMRDGEARPRLVVSVPFSIAEPWLVPCLVELAHRFPRIAIDIRVEDDPVDLARHAIDLRISYGDYHYPGMKVVRLMHDEVVPVCAPSFADRPGGTGAALDAAPESAFIHTTWGASYASHPSWADWFRHAGLARRPDPMRGRRVGLSSLAIAAARSGLGVALAQRALARSDIESGRLVALSTVSLKLGHAYGAFLPKNKPLQAEIATLLELLRR
ncbi:MAG: LysR family transcriptional regulator [Rhizobiaceae bacterium]|nr:LysR family transcriptional regulator [Rhizobiaceae bacterium]